VKICLARAAAERGGFLSVGLNCRPGETFLEERSYNGTPALTVCPSVWSAARRNPRILRERKNTTDRPTEWHRPAFTTRLPPACSLPATDRWPTAPVRTSRSVAYRNISEAATVRSVIDLWVVVRDVTMNTAVVGRSEEQRYRSYSELAWFDLPHCSRPALICARVLYPPCSLIEVPAVYWPVPPRSPRQS